MEEVLNGEKKLDLYFVGNFNSNLKFINSNSIFL